MDNSKIKPIAVDKVTTTTSINHKEKQLQLLHEYNNIKDATQIVLGALAEAKGLPIKELHKMYNLPSSG